MTWKNAIIFFILLLTSTLVRADCFYANKEIKCQIPIEMNIPENKKFFDAKLENKSIITLVGKSINIYFKFINMKEESKELEYYLYAYKGSTCVSCDESRDENMGKILINPYSEIKLNKSIIINREGDFNYKLKYREIGLKTWKEMRGNITSKTNDINNNENVKKNNSTKNNSNKTNENRQEQENQSIELVEKTYASPQNEYNNSKLTYETKTKRYTKYIISAGGIVILTLGAFLLLKQS